MKPTFFSSFLVLEPTSDDFARDLTLYYRHTSLFAQREGFFISCFPHSSRPAPPSSPDLLPFRSSSPTPFTPPPPSFSFLPTFPSPSPITARTRALSRTTRVRVRPHVPTRQEVFFYCLHLFTQSPQSAVHQHIRCEEKQEKAFTKCTTSSQSTHKTPDFIRRKLHLITAVNPIHHHREHKNQKPSPLTRCETTICGIPVKR